MSLTVLFDLDDTLLNNQIQTFLPAYLKALSACLDQSPPEQVIQYLLYATQKMIEEPSPAITLEANFDYHFYPALRRSRQELQAQIDHFYNKVYPSLHTLTSPHPDAVKVVAEAAEHGNTVVVATNPLFPATAIEQRVKWAGFSSTYPFALITNYSDFHYSKPHPAFLAEILAQLAWVEQPAVMIGNDIKEDLIPASKLGLPVFWVNATKPTLPSGFHPLSRSGELNEVPSWLRQVNQSKVEMKIESPEAIQAVLESTPAAFDTFKRKHPSLKNWIKQPAPNEWNSSEIICHLRDVEIEVNLPRMKTILQEENPFIPGIPTDEWAAQRRYNHQDPYKAIMEFIAARIETIQLVKGLVPSDWKRSARHAIFGPTSLQEMLGFIALHDQNHIRQVFPLLKAN